MNYIRKFIDKVSLLESRSSKDLVMPITEARMLRDEVSKLLSELVELQTKNNTKEDVIKVEIAGGKFK